MNELEKISVQSIMELNTEATALKGELGMAAYRYYTELAKIEKEPITEKNTQYTKDYTQRQLTEKYHREEQNLSSQYRKITSRIEALCKALIAG